jgi:hypothetical protein
VKRAEPSSYRPSSRGRKRDRQSTWRRRAGHVEENDHVRLPDTNSNIMADFDRVAYAG